MMRSHYLNEQETSDLLPTGQLVAALKLAVADYQQGLIVCPNRFGAPLAEGVMLAMPASAPDIAMTKLLNIVPSNRNKGLKTINGQVIIWDVQTGLHLATLDGPTVTAKRTAAISMLAIEKLMPNPQLATIYGTGTQARSHVLALAELYPQTLVRIIGRNLEDANNFCQEFSDIGLSVGAVEQVPEEADVVLTITTSGTPVYSEAARVGRLVIGVGVFQPDKAEIGANTLHESALFIDDLPSAAHEAGDFLVGGVDLERVHSLYDLLYGRIDLAEKSVVFKSVGCAAWDIAACRVVMMNLSTAA